LIGKAGCQLNISILSSLHRRTTDLTTNNRRRFSTHSTTHYQLNSLLSTPFPHLFLRFIRKNCQKYQNWVTNTFRQCAIQYASCRENDSSELAP